MLIRKTNSAGETIAFAEELGGTLKGGEIIAYKGGLGAGKTTFTRGLAIGMGIPDHVSSPTFALVNEYHGDPLTLYHFDMYRVLNRESLETTGFYDYMYDDCVIAVEWSENIADAIDELEGVITVEIKHIGAGDEREITVCGGK